MAIGVREDATIAMGKRQTQRQQELWIPVADIPKAPGHPFYRKLNALLAEHGFDPFAAGLCHKFYHEELGRPGVPPGVYFRMLLIGYFEGIDSRSAASPGAAWGGLNAPITRSTSSTGCSGTGKATPWPVAPMRPDRDGRATHFPLVCQGQWREDADEGH